jgi:hypothetical protein
MLVRHITILASALLLGSQVSAHAELFNTIGVGGDTSRTISSGTSAESFVATSTGLGDLELELSKTNVASTGSVVITIRADTGTDRPAASVFDSVATISETLIPTTESLFDVYNIALTNPLTIGTRYFLEVTTTGSNSASIYTTPDAPTAGTASTSLVAGATDYSYSGGAGITSTLLMACVSADSSCLSFNGGVAYDTINEAPEPASMAILGTGLISLGWSRRRAKAKHVALHQASLT